MKRHAVSAHTPGGRTSRRYYPSSAPVRAAVCAALYGVTQASHAQQASETPVASLEEVTVTASRRAESMESVPYSMSVVSGEQLAATGVTDTASLATEVPGLSMYDYGGRDAAATVPIIRGINATGEPTRGFRTFEQSPVGVYIDNSPVEGYYQLDDVKQIEVLRGPQGTLYGAGALGGALRIIPNAPVLNEFSGTIEASGGRLDHSSSTAYSARALVNVPIGDTLAIRVPVKYDYQPGFVDTYGLFKRSNNGLSGVPLLADPAAPLTSPAIYQDQPNWNYQRTITMRPSILWQPVDAFTAELAVLHSYADGDGGPQVNRDFPGGVSPIDPATTLPAGGYFREFSQIDQHWSRHTNVASLDLSYDAGFATLSSTSSYHNTSGSTLQDNTYSLAGLADGGYVPYYAGVPTNPRFVYDQLFADTEHTFAQEIRLVSKTRLFDLFDYVVGAYYENQTRTGSWTIAIPGTPEYQAAQGCTAADCGGGFFIATAPGDVTFQQVDTQKFTDKSVFGELTWHVVQKGQITFGVRHFDQQFTDSQSYDDYPFPTHLPATPHESPASKTVGKVNPSYEYATDQFVYALWSQGFRRGGANSVPLAGPFRESPLLSTYQPDTTNNYEAGFKGRLSNAFSYTVAVFDIKWDHPQISSSLPSGNLAVYNAKTAESKGVEFESSGPLFLPRLAYSIGFAYADAHLTSNFSLPANNGTQTGTIVPGLITGTSGEQMPGSPKTSTSAALIYDQNVSPGYDLGFNLNGVYRSTVPLQLTPTLGVTTVQHSSVYDIVNLSVALVHKPWRASLYVTNLFDHQSILVSPTQVNELDKLTNDYVVDPPREIGVRFGYTF